MEESNIIITSQISGREKQGKTKQNNDATKKVIPMEGDADIDTVLCSIGSCALYYI